MYTDSIIVTLQTSDNIACHSWFNLIMYSDGGHRQLQATVWEQSR